MEQGQKMVLVRLEWSILRKNEAIFGSMDSSTIVPQIAKTTYDSVVQHGSRLQATVDSLQYMLTQKESVWFTFLPELSKSWAWPLIVGVGILCFRKPIIEFINNAEYLEALGAKIKRRAVAKQIEALEEEQAPIRDAVSIVEKTIQTTDDPSRKEKLEKDLSEVKTKLAEIDNAKEVLSKVFMAMDSKPFVREFDIDGIKTNYENILIKIAIELRRHSSKGEIVFSEDKINNTIQRLVQYHESGIRTELRLHPREILILKAHGILDSQSKITPVGKVLLYSMPPGISVTATSDFETS